MPRPPRGTGKKPPSYRLHKASGHAIVTIKGQDYYLGPHGSTDSMEKYHELCRTLIGEHAVAAVAPGRRHTISQLTFAYWEFAQRYYAGAKRTGEKSLIAAAIKAVVNAYPSIWVDEFGPLKLKEVRATLVKQRRYDDRIKRSYINKLVARIKRMFRWGVEEELVPSSVAHALDAVAGLKKGRTEAKESDPVTPVDDAVVDATLPHMPPMIQIMVRLQRLTGMRPGEVCSIRPGEIDQTHDVWLYQPKQHKTAHHGRGRVVPIGPRAQELLRPFMDRAPSAACFSPAEARAKQYATMRANRVAKVQPSQKDRSKVDAKRRPKSEYAEGNYRNAIYRACDALWPHKYSKANPKKLTEAQKDELRQWRREHSWHPNQIRHTRGTEVRRDYGLEGAQVTLGHASMNVTEVYAEKDVHLAMQIARETG